MIIKVRKVVEEEIEVPVELEVFVRDQVYLERRPIEEIIFELIEKDSSIAPIQYTGEIIHFTLS